MFINDGCRLLMRDTWRDPGVRLAYLEVARRVRRGAFAPPKANGPQVIDAIS